MTAVRVTKLERHDGFFTANVSADGVTIRADNTLGSWTTTSDPQADPGARNVPRREIRPEVARKLADRVRAYLRGEPADDTTVEVAPTPVPELPALKAIAREVAKAAAKAVKEAA